MSRTPVGRIQFTITALDLMFSVGVGLAYVMVMDIPAGIALAVTLGVAAALWAVKIVVWRTLAGAQLRPLARWHAGQRPPDAAALTRLVTTAYQTPLALGAWWAGLFALQWALTTVVLYFGFADQVPLGPSAFWGTGLLCGAYLCGGLTLAVPLIGWHLTPIVESVSLAAIERRLPPPSSGRSFRSRLAALALALALAPSLFQATVTLMNDARADQRLLVHRAEVAAAEVALGNPEAARQAGGRIFMLAAGAVDLRAPEVARAFEDLPALARAFERAAAAGPAGAASHPREGAAAFRPHAGQRIGVVLPGAASGELRTALLLLLFFAIAAVWGPLCATFIARSTAQPVVRVSEALAHIGAGQVAAAPRMPILYPDEVGTLTQAYNTMTDQLLEISRRAAEVSRGELDAEVALPGDLGDALRTQLASLREIVGHIRRSSSLLTGAAGELHAAAQDQEQTAERQSASIDDINRTMSGLLAAAAHVTESATGVLERAERTRETTERTADRIGELSAHAVRIGELLEVIREIAAHSNLLALNASLEAVRAGPAGRSFVLVAGELRKLNQRIAASVVDIQRLVDDIQSSMSAAVSATTESRTLAEGTSSAAQRINLITQQQRSGTEQAGESVRDVSALVSDALLATQQVRALAGNLKAQADLLARLVERFRLPGA